VGEEKPEFNPSKVMTSPYFKDVCYRVYVNDKVVFDKMGTLNPPLNLLEACLLGTLNKRVDV